MHPKTSRDPVVVAACRTALGRKGKSFGAVRPDDLASFVIKELLKRAPGLDPQDIEDVIFGCAFPEAEQGMNVARVASVIDGLPFSVPAMTLNRFCSSGLQSIAIAADMIKAGTVDVVLAGGVESMTMIPMGGKSYSENPAIQKKYPLLYVSMIAGAEILRKHYGISRKEQDEFSLWSHQKAVAAEDAGKFKDEIFAVHNGAALVAKDDGPRRDTTLEKLLSLKPVMGEPDSTVTAGNASQVSDGAAGVLVMSRAKAGELGLRPMARFLGYAVRGVAPEFFGIGPALAIPKALKKSGLSLSDIGLIEMNEAFAVQVLAVLKEIDLNRDILNVNGGAVALGHPLGCSGARIAATLLYEMRRRGVEFGLETMCVGGGMGAAGIFQLEN